MVKCWEGGFLITKYSRKHNIACVRLENIKRRHIIRFTPCEFRAHLICFIWRQIKKFHGTTWCWRIYSPHTHPLYRVYYRKICVPVYNLLSYYTLSVKFDVEKIWQEKHFWALKRWLSYLTDFIEILMTAQREHYNIHVQVYEKEKINPTNWCVGSVFIKPPTYCHSQRLFSEFWAYEGTWVLTHDITIESHCIFYTAQPFILSPCHVVLLQIVIKMVLPLLQHHKRSLFLSLTVLAFYEAPHSFVGSILIYKR